MPRFPALLLLLSILAGACDPGAPGEQSRPASGSGAPERSEPPARSAVSEVPRIPGPRPEPSEGDGRGTATVEPADPVRISSRGSWRIDFTAAEPGIAVGGSVLLQISPFWGWTAPQTTQPSYPGYVSVRTDAGATTLAVHANPGQHQVWAAVEGAPLAPGSRVTFVYGDTSSGAHPEAAARADRFAEEEEEFLVKVDGDGDGYAFAIPESPSIDVLPGPAARLLVTGPSFARPGDAIELRVAVVDVRRNRATDFTGAVRLRSLDPGIEHPERIEIRREHRGAVAVPARAVMPGVARVLATDEDEDLALSVSNPVLVTERDLPYRLYWGDLQIHTGLSDGTGMPETVYQYAREVAGLDVAAITDHDAHGVFALDEAPAVWDRLARAAREAHEPGRFVTFLGYEWTSWTHGHKHVLYLDDEAPLLSNRDAATSDPPGLWSRLPRGRAITVSHHTLGSPVPTDWTHHDPVFEPVVEIVSVHGSSEGKGAPMAVRGAREGHGVRDALARGYRLGFVGSGDTHNGHPGMGDPAAPLGGVAGIYAPELTREAVFEAIRERRVYASSGPRVILDFTLNNLMMGSVVRLDDPGAERVLHMEAYSPIRIESRELIKNGRVILREPVGDLRTVLEVEDPEPARDGDRYYVRLGLLHEQMVWSSPIFVELGSRGDGSARDPAEGR